EPQPGLLHGVVGLAGRAEHPVRHRPKPRAIRLESLRQPVAVHRSHSPELFRHSSDGPERARVTERRWAMKDTQKSAEGTTANGKTVKGFTAEERAAMKAHAQELRADTVDGESAVLAKLAEMPEPDRALGERLHAVIKASAPTLAPKTW